MKKIMSILGLASSLFLTACTPTMQQMPKSEPGKGTVMLYSSTLQPTSSLYYSIDSRPAGSIDGGKVQVVYLTPGTYQFSVRVPSISEPLNKKLTVRAGQPYFLDVYSTVTRSRLQTTYHIQEIPKEEAMRTLQGPKKFTGWTDLVLNTLNSASS